MAPIYVLRFFFDYGCGVALWAGNDAADDRFDCAVNAIDIPLSAETAAEIDRLDDWFYHSLNWDSPSDPGPWRQEECDRFNDAARELLARIRQELPDEYEVVDEFRPLEEDPDLDRYLRNPKRFRREGHWLSWLWPFGRTPLRPR